MTHVEWTPLTEDDLPALASLARACLDRDGGLPLLADEFMLRRLFLQGEGIGGRDITGDLVAAASCWVGEGLDRQATGLVAPDVRQQGIGEELVRWVRERAGGAGVRFIAETTSPESNSLLARAGLTLTFAETVMRHRLRDVPRVPLADGLTLLPFTADTADLFHAAYRGSFADRPGFPDTPRDEWLAWLQEGGDLRPEDCRVALTEDGEPVGFVTVSEGWIDQVGVVPAWRGRGLGAHLVVRSLTALRKAGAREVWLAVNIDNPAARVLYERLGFKAKGMRARYADRSLVTPV